MKEFELNESTIPAELAYNLLENYEMMWMPNRTPGLYRVIFFTIAEILKHNKSKSGNRVGFILKTIKGDFKFGAILTYHAPEDADASDDDKGNFTLEFTLNPDDMKDIEIIVDNHSDLFINACTRKAQEIMYGKFLSMEYCNNIFCEAIDTLIKFLDVNASETQEVSVVYRGVFTATVTVENDEKIIDIVPGEMIKQFIKGDSTL